jgi:serine/threonine protein phosphatase PrpC
VEHFGAAQWIGRRARQEDCLGVLPANGARAAATRPRLMVLSDGMGGAAAGDKAARLIVDTFLGAYEAEEADGAPIGRALREAAEAANRAVARAVELDPELDGMGGTLLAIALVEGGAMMISIGDSPLWRVRSGQVKRLNADHSVGGALDEAVARGEISPEVAREARDRNSVTSVIVGAPLHTMRVDETIDVIPMTAGDLLVAASDGLETLSEPEIAHCLAAAGSAEDCAKSLVEAVKVVGHPKQDNTTVLIARF